MSMFKWHFIGAFLVMASATQAQVAFQSPAAVQGFWEGRLNQHGDDDEVWDQIDALSFMRNTEFFNAREEGATRFGMMLRRIQSASSGLNAKLEYGAVVMHHYGGQTFVAPHLAMVHWLPAGPSKWSLRLGSLTRPDHGLKLPLYNPDLLYTRPVEYGLQLRGPRVDLWWAWDQAIDYGSPLKEAFTAGLVADPILLDVRGLKMGADVQVLYHHIGGQIDASPSGPEGNLVESYLGPFVRYHWNTHNALQLEAGVLQSYDAFVQWNIFQWSTGRWAALRYEGLLAGNVSVHSELSWGDVSMFQSRKGQPLYQRDPEWWGCIIEPLYITQLQTRLNWKQDAQIWSIGLSQFKEAFKPGVQWAFDFNVMLPIDITRMSSVD